MESYCNPDCTSIISQEKGSCNVKELWSDLHQELKITEIDLLDETFKPVFSSKSSCKDTKLTMDVKSKRSRSSPSLTLLCREQPSSTSFSDRITSTGSDCAKKQPSESDILSSLHKNVDAILNKYTESAPAVEGPKENKKKPQQQMTPLHTDDPAHKELCKSPSKETCLDKVVIAQTSSFSGAGDIDKSKKQEILQEDKRISCDAAKKRMILEVEVVPLSSVCLEDRCNTLELPNLDDDEGCGGNSEDLDLVESWEDLSSTKQWVTSPLHSPDVEELLSESPFCSGRETLSPEVGKISDNSKQSTMKNTERLSGNIPQTCSSQPETKWMLVPSAPARISVNSNNATQPHTGKCSTAKQKNTVSSHRFYRQMSYEAAASEKREENSFPKHRPYSLNLDLGHRCIRDISNQQNRNSSEFSSSQRGLQIFTGAVNNGVPTELDLFLNDRQAPLRRNSAPVSVSSVRTAFMIKTCQAKAVPVVPPKVQYSQIPHSRHEKDTVKEQEKEHCKMSAEKSNAGLPLMMSDLQEELENKEPPPNHQKHPNVEKSAEVEKTTSSPDLPVIKRRHAPSLEVFVDCPRPNRGNLLQRPSFRNRQRPQSLILLSPPFPIMDYPPSGDDSKLLSPIKSLNDASAVNVFPKEMAENIRAQDGITLQNKMTIPKSGQRLETSTSCFYQPQRRSMIFDSRSHRQIE